MDITFESLPKAVTHLTQEVSEIKKLLLENRNEKPVEAERWLNLNELCQYHPDRPTKPTVYGWVNAGLIPVHKGGKKLRFLKTEIDAWLMQGRKKTSAETDRETDQYLNSQKNKGGCHA